MAKYTDDNWQKHLVDLDNHYQPAKFFSGHENFNDPASLIEDHFFSNNFNEEINLPEEAQLSIDVYHDENNFFVIAPIAGVKPETLSINLDKDILTIKGERDHAYQQNNEQYIYQECYWGKFSRSLILPLPVIANQIEATLDGSVLRIKLPKAEESGKVEIKVRNMIN